VHRVHCQQGIIRADDAHVVRNGEVEVLTDFQGFHGVIVAGGVESNRFGQALEFSGEPVAFVLPLQ